MKDEIKVELRSVYGKVLAYPVNDQAHKLAKILSTKTFTKETLSGLKDMGFVISSAVAEVVL